MTIFRDDFTAKLAIKFGLLLCVKMFHWIAQDRIDFMEQTPIITKLFHLRMISVLASLVVINSLMVWSAYLSLVDSGPSMMILFGFEYAVLLTISLGLSIKYVLQTIDRAGEDSWDNKPLYVFYVDLVNDLIKLLLLICFFVTLMNFYGLPLHIIRDLFSTFRSFAKRVHDLFKSRRAIRALDTFPDVTATELADIDDTCVICREEMDVAGKPKRLPCGHAFHYSCLRSWLARDQICPTCRQDVVPVNVPADAVRAAAAARHAAAAPAAPAVPAAPAAPTTPAVAAAATTDQVRATPASAHAATPAASAAAAAASPAAATASSTSYTAPPIPGFPPPPVPPAGLPAFPPPPPIPTPLSGASTGGHFTLPTAFGFPQTPFGFPPSTPAAFPGSPFGSQRSQLPPGFVPFSFDVTAPGATVDSLTLPELDALEGREREKVPPPPLFSVIPLFL